MTYDKTRLDEAIKKMAGNELKPTDIINGPSGAEGPSEVRYRAHVAFSTVNDLLNNLESVHNRRKALSTSATATTSIRSRTRASA